MTRTYTGLVPDFADPGDWTLATVLGHHARIRPDATFLITPEEDASWTYREMLGSAQRVAGGLVGGGAVPGDRLVIMAANSSRLVRSWFGAALCGVVEVPVNTNYEGEFLRHQVRTVAPRFAVIDDRFAERFAAIAEAARGIERFWVIDTGRGEQAIALLRRSGWAAGPWDDLEAGPALCPPDPDPAAPRQEDLGAIFFTSGTTGPSKGVAMPHAQLYFFAQIVVTLTRLTAADTYLTTTPLFHGNAQFMAVYPALVAGARAVVRPRFSASRWIDQVRESGVTVTNFVGVMMDFVWKQPRRPDDADNALRAVYAAPTASSIVAGFRERFGVETVLDAFGLTETCAPILSPYGEQRPPGAAGLAAAEWFDIRLVDPRTDRDVPVGEIGELVVRPKQPWLCSLGYYNMPERTVEAWRNLWFHTGDALRRDAEGWFYFVDRYKDALRRRGENISSYEVEQALLGHPAVAECAVVGVPSEIEAGEDEVLAVVVPGGPLDPGDLLRWCRGRVPDFAVPRYLRVVDAIPKTPSEKVRKAELRRIGVTPDTLDRQRDAGVAAPPRSR